MGLPILSDTTHPSGFLWPSDALPPFRPITTFILKISSRCNLNCGYCYEYKSPDQSWRTRPKLMSLATVDSFGRRAHEHIIQNNLRKIFVLFHGGEPLLAGSNLLSDYCQSILQNVGEARCKLLIQTNGTLIDDSILDLFERFRFSVGVSVDGPPDVQNKNRPFHHGGGSAALLEEGILKLQRRQIALGALTVIDINQNPARVYDYLSSLKLSSLNFLLPDCHHITPPPVAAPMKDYGDWLIELFDRWYVDQNRPFVTAFISIIRLLFGRATLSDIYGGTPGTQCVISTDGMYEGLDVLKTCYDGCVKTNLSLATASIDQVCETPIMRAFAADSNFLCTTCKTCSFLETCGGGYYPHRYAKNGFVNPSIYCADNKKLLLYIAKVVANDLKSRCLAPPVDSSTLLKECYQSLAKTSLSSATPMKDTQTPPSRTMTN